MTYTVKKVENLNNQITTEGINRLKAAVIEVTLWNGAYHVATAKAEFAKHRYELRVTVTHPYLVWACGDQKGVELWKVEGSRVLAIEMSSELAPLVLDMQAKATMSNEEALRQSNSLSDAHNRTLLELGIKCGGSTR